MPVYTSHVMFYMRVTLDMSITLVCAFIPRKKRNKCTVGLKPTESPKRKCNTSPHKCTIGRQTVVFPISTHFLSRRRAHHPPVWVFRPAGGPRDTLSEATPEAYAAPI